MRCGRGGAGRKIDLREIIEDAFVGAVLFVDLQNTGVLGVAGGEDFGRLTLQENRGVGAVTVDHAADDDHGRKQTRGERFRE